MSWEYDELSCSCHINPPCSKCVSFCCGCEERVEDCICEEESLEEEIKNLLKKGKEGDNLEAST